jgi:N-methylhydantoinase B
VSGFDSVRLAVLSSRFEGIVNSMMNTIFRTGRSGVLNSANDFSCCILTADHQLLVGAESLPIHTMSGPDLIARYVSETHPGFRAGDAFFHNSPYHGNSHAADHCIVVPVVDSDGEHRLTILTKAHQADCGNSQPTTYMGAAADVYEEGALIFPAFRVQTDYRDNQDFIRAFQVRVRVPDQWWGDYLALLGAARIGERRVLEFAADVGWDNIEAFAAEWFDYSERQMATAISRLPSGRASFRSVHDPFPGAPDGVPITAHVAVDANDATVEVDLTDNPDCLPNGLNLTEATARTAAMVGVFNSIGAGVAANAGSFRRIRVKLRENCVAGIPRHPASCSVATTNIADRATSAVQCAMAELADGRGMAEAGSVIPASAAVISGNDPRWQNEPFVNQIFLTLTGGAAAPNEDGWLTICHVGNAGMLRRDSVEMTEMRHPIRVVDQHIVPDTEGAGRYRGAPSAYVEYGPVGTSVVAAYGADGTINPAAGVRGGLAGGAAKHQKRMRDGRVVPLESSGFERLEDGETIICLTCGGGGYGPPAERDDGRVAHDVREGWISAQRAREVYGVELD